MLRVGGGGRGAVLVLLGGGSRARHRVSIPLHLGLDQAVGILEVAVDALDGSLDAVFLEAEQLAYFP